MQLLKELDTGFVPTGEHMDFENQKTHQHTDLVIMWLIRKLVSITLANGG